MSSIPLTGLPEGCHVDRPEIKIMENGHYSQDIVQIVLKDGIIIDGGQYGCQPFFNVMVISKENWDHPVESCICQTIEQLVKTVIQLCHKYSEDYYARVAIDW